MGAGGRDGSSNCAVGQGFPTMKMASPSGIGNIARQITLLAVLVCSACAAGLGASHSLAKVVRVEFGAT